MKGTAWLGFRGFLRTDGSIQFWSITLAIVLAVLLALPAPALGAPPLDSQLAKGMPSESSSSTLAERPSPIGTATHIQFTAHSFDPLLDPTSPEELAAFREICFPSALNKRYALVQKEGIIDQEWRSQIHGLGLEILGYVPANAYIVRGEQALLKAAESMPRTRWVGPFLPAYKLSPTVLSLLEGADHPNLMRDPHGRLFLKVVFFPGEDPRRYSSLITRPSSSTEVSWANPDGAPYPNLVLLVPPDSLDDVVSRAVSCAAVLFLEPGFEAGPVVDETIWHIQSGEPDNPGALPKNYDFSAELFSKGLFGVGQVYGFIDSGLESDMCFFRYGAAPADVTFFDSNCNPPPPGAAACQPTNKVITYYAAPGADASAMCNDHGTHTTGIGAGDDFTHLARDDDPAADDDPLYSTYGINIDHHDTADGLASGAQIVVQDVTAFTNCNAFVPSLFNQIGDFYTQAYDTGVRVHNNSWGRTIVGGEPIYGPETSAIDFQSFYLRDMLIVFSAGNEGEIAGCGTGNTIRRKPQHAKDVVLVGATNKASTDLGSGPGEDVACYSSHGPAIGRRLKPDIVAPGGDTPSDVPIAVGILSPDPDRNLTTDDCDTSDAPQIRGTSFSAPAISGLSLLVREYFQRGFYPTGVESSLNSFIPTNALLKAILVNSARNLLGVNTADSGPGHQDRPSYGQGWGAPAVGDVLFFDGDPDEPGERARFLLLTDTPNGLVNAYDINDNRSRIVAALHPAIVGLQTHKYMIEVVDDSESLYVTLNSEPRTWAADPDAVFGPG